MELLIPGFLVLIAAALGGFIAVFTFVILYFKIRSSTNTARHNYMARQLRRREDAIKQLRKRNDDSDPLQPFTESSTRKHRDDWFMELLLDRFYGGETPKHPERGL